MSDKPDQPLWEIDQANSADHWLELKDPEGWRSAEAKWDGCIHYYRYFNTPKGMDEENDKECNYIHICDIDEEIARLQALKRIAANYFVERGQDEFWKPETVEGSVQPVLQIEGTKAELEDCQGFSLPARTDITPEESEKALQELLGE